MSKQTNPVSVDVLQECVDLQLKKSRDYQNPNSTVQQADYYPNGITTIHDIMHAKMLRMKSVMEECSRMITILTLSPLKIQQKI